MLKPGGTLVLSTLNRTHKAFALAVFGAERVAGLLPPGTHDWDRFVTPEEADALERGETTTAEAKEMAKPKVNE